MALVRQTRQEDYDAIVAWNNTNPDDKVPVPEVIGPNTRVGQDRVASEADHNGADVRYIDQDKGIMTGWHRPDKINELEAAKADLEKRLA